MQPQASPASSGVMLTRKGQKYADHHSHRRPSQRTLRQLAKLRQEAEAEIERLIGFLDKTEPDPDLEPSLAGDYNNHAGDFGDDREADDAEREPTFGWTEHEARFGCQATPLQTDEAEDPHIDDEPSLGSIENHPSDTRRPNFYGELVGYFTGTTTAGSQLKWAAGNREDLEGDPREDDEEGGDEEPSLGSYNVIPGRSMVDGDALWPGQSQVVDSGMDQGDWSAGGTDDGEAAHDGLEPSLGWSGNVDQDGGANWRGNAEDREPDNDEQDENGDEQDRDGGLDDNGVPPSPAYRRRLFARRGQLHKAPAKDASCVITGPDGNQYRVIRQ